MILLAFSMGMIEINDFLICQGKVCPVCAKFSVRNKEKLPVPVHGTLGNLIYYPDTNGLFRFIR